jgi:threonine dehydratase
MITLADVQAARERIRQHVRHTPLLDQPNVLDDPLPGLRLKLENLQVAGSFKPRGVFNTLLQFQRSEIERGVVAASGGNHGLALAYAAHRLGVPATVYIPETATADRERRIAAWGAKVVRSGSVWDDAYAHSLTENLPNVHPFDADATLAGQGTLGLELLDDLPDMDAVLIAIGGGGLLAGMALAIRALKPSVHIIGVEPVGANKMKASVEAGHLVTLPSVRTIADTLSPRMVSERTLDIARQFVDDFVLVDDTAMVQGMRWLWRNANQLVEPAGAAVIAALQTGAVNLDRFHMPVALICGGNAGADSIFTQYDEAARTAVDR